MLLDSTVRPGPRTKPNPFCVCGRLGRRLIVSNTSYSCCMYNIAIKTVKCHFMQAVGRGYCGEYPFFRIIDITQEKGLCSQLKNVRRNFADNKEMARL